MLLRLRRHQQRLQELRHLPLRRLSRTPLLQQETRQTQLPLQLVRQVQQRQLARRLRLPLPQPPVLPLVQRLQLPPLRRLLPVLARRLPQDKPQPVQLLQLRIQPQLVQLLRLRIQLQPVQLLRLRVLQQPVQLLQLQVLQQQLLALHRRQQQDQRQRQLPQQRLHLQQQVQRVHLQQHRRCLFQLAR